MERFATILQKNPRPGTSFDKVYGYHVERRTVDDWVAKHRQRAEAGRGNEAAADWMIAGLIVAQRGGDVESIQAFTVAESLDVSSFMAALLLGKSLIATGQSAAEAIERAIQRQPAGADLLDVLQALGASISGLKQDNEAGLIAYYEKWIEGRPEDIDAALRLARLLPVAGRRNDAQAMLRQCLKRAPSNKDLRQTLIAQLSNNHQYREAADQYLALNNLDPNNPDTLGEWGRTILRDTSRDRV